MVQAGYPAGRWRPEEHHPPDHHEKIKVYERASIERWLQQKRSSPSTGLAMGTKLTLVLQVRTIIEAVVTSGAIDEVCG